MKKLITYLLVISFVLAPLSFILTGCADKNPPPPDNTDENTVDSGEETEETKVWDDIPEDTYFDNTSLTFLVWSQCIMTEFDSSGIAGDLVGDEIFERNSRIEQDLGVKLKFVRASGASSSATAELRAKAEADISSGAGEYDVLAAYSLMIPMMALYGSVHDLATLDYINFDKPYYPASLVDNCMANGKLFWLTGDISTNLLWLMYVTIFSKSVFEDYGLESPYDLVRQNKWTIDKLYEMTTERYEDNGNDIVDAGDFFGLTMYNNNIDAFIGMSDIRILEKDSENKFILSPTLGSQKTFDLISDLGTRFNSVDWTCNADSSLAREIFFEERSILLIDSIYLIAGKDRDGNQDKLDFKYGIIPTPKYNDQQEKFSTPISFNYTNYGISIATKNLDASAAVLERMGSENYNSVTPIVFETAMKERYSHDNDASEMFDLIRGGLNLDMGRIYTVNLSSIYYNIRMQIVNNKQSFTSEYQSLKRSMEQFLIILNKTFYD